MMSKPDIDTHLDEEITKRVHSVNRLKGLVKDPENIVLVTTQDIVEIFHELYAYTAKMYDELQEENIKSRAESKVNKIGDLLDVHVLEVNLNKIPVIVTDVDQNEIEIPLEELLETEEIIAIIDMMIKAELRKESK